MTNLPLISVLRGVSGPPEGFNEIKDYRTFTIVAEILEHAYNGSYKLEVLYDDIIVGSVSSLARGLETKCAGCQGRRKSKNRIRGTIVVHPTVIIEIAKLVQMSDGHDDVETFQEVLRRRFKARMVGPTGAVLAVASNDIDLNKDGKEPLPEEKCPIMTIHSSSVATHKNDGYCAFFDDDEHGDLLTGKWASVPMSRR
jgi:tyrosinase